MMNLLKTGVLPALLFLCLSNTSHGPVANASPQDATPNSTPARADITVVGATATTTDGPRFARSDGQAHGRLRMLRVDVDCVDATPRVARRVLAAAIGLNLVDHFPREREAVTTIDLRLQDVEAIEALETILGFSFAAGAPTWQVRDGILEVGPRDRLAVRTRPLTRVIEITDMLLEPPKFVPPDHLLRKFGAVQNPNQSNGRDPLAGTMRRQPREIGAELIQSLVDGVEPDAWNPLTDEDRDSGLSDPVDPRDPFQGRNLDPRASYPGSSTLAPIFVQGRWASIRLHGKTLVVRGPAFVLQGIEGLPEAVPPPASLVPSRR
ncbi:MAG: hypothetical protein GY895_16940 [Phycisphaera sp.]|nr:hypothetical protein [Phycisphaera sp.]